MFYEHAKTCLLTLFFLQTVAAGLAILFKDYRVVK